MPLVVLLVFGPDRGPQYERGRRFGVESDGGVTVGDGTGEFSASIAKLSSQIVVDILRGKPEGLVQIGEDLPVVNAHRQPDEPPHHEVE